MSESAQSDKTAPYESGPARDQNLAQAPPPAAVTQAGRYELLGEIAHGGMGKVLRGRDPELDRELAIKVLLDRYHDDPRMLRRFLTEARISGSLQHPGVVPVYELGRLADQRPFLAMKLVQGRTLAELFKERQGTEGPPGSWPDVPRFLTVFGQVCQAVAYAHSRGVIHRDLKPGNVMVGAFGEVQVMDWGLAKVLLDDAGQSSPAEPAAAGVPGGAGSASDGVTPEVLAGGPTHAGTVLGTPAFMPPEQARGEVDSLDERCDVFSLGAILCQLLTGQAPYTGRGAAEVHPKAQRGDLAEAFARLDGCGAEGDLLALAKRCLAPDMEDRPRHAGQVAEAVERYQAQVQERLRQAELAREKAQVQADEERKRREVEQARAEAEQAQARAERRRRRVQFWLMGVASLFALTVLGAGSWYALEETRKADHRAQLVKTLDERLAELQKKRQRLHEQLAKAMTAAALMSDVDGWGALVEGMYADWKQADELARGNSELLGPSWLEKLPALEKKIAADKREWQLAKKYDDIRLKASTLVEGKSDPGVALREYPPQFRELQLDLEKDALTALATSIGKSRLRHVLVAALDDWAFRLPMVTKEQPRDWRALQARLLEVARKADPDPWRDQVREPKTEVARLRGLVARMQPGQQTPQILNLLAARLGVHKGTEKEAVTLLRKALVHHPKDYWLLVGLGDLAQDPLEKVGCYRATLALRPRNSRAYNNLGNALHNQKDYQGAEAALRKALDNEPRFAHAWANLGNALAAQKDYKGAEAAYQKALVIDPQFAGAWYNLGIARTDQKDYKGAEAAYQKALAIDSQFVKAWHNLGVVRADQKDFKGAEAAHRQSLAIDRQDAPAWTSLGAALRGQKDYPGAETAIHIALAIDSKLAPAWTNLGLVRADQKDFQGAAAAHRQALAIDPRYTKAWHNLGIALADQKDYPGAEAAHRQALAIDPNDALAWTGVGVVRHALKDYPGAEVAIRKALDVDPRYATAWTHLGTVRHAQKDYQGAEAAHRQALVIDPQDVQAWTNLGNALCDQNGYQKAEAAYRKALAIDPQHAQAWTNLGLALAQRKDANGAEAAHRKALASDPQFATAWYNLGTALHDKQDAKGAATAYQKALAIDPQIVSAWYNLGVALSDQEDYPRAIVALQKAVVLEPKKFQAHGALGRALLAQGDFAQAHKATERAWQLLSPGHPLRALAQEQLRQCQQALRQERRALELAQGKAAPSGPAELCQLAQFCRHYQRCQTAARLFAAAFAAQPGLAENLAQGYRWQAAGAAARAAAGLGRDAGPLEAKDKAQLRRQALDWLNAELKPLSRVLTAYRDVGPAPVSPLEKLTAKTQKPGPADILRVCDQLQRWQTEPDLASLRGVTELAQLPPNDQKACRQLWIDVRALEKQARSCFTERQWLGSLAAEQKERVQEVKLQAGKVYVLDLESRTFDSMLRVEDDQGQPRAEDKGWRPGLAPNSRILFPPPKDGTYHLVITAVGPRSTGNYTLIVREFAGPSQ